MMNQYIKELEQEPFNADEFVERMVRRSMQEIKLKLDEQFDSEAVHDIFTQAIQDLKVLQERQERKCNKLEQSVKEEEKIYLSKLSEIMDHHTHCVNVFSTLDECMSRCGGRALDVGEKLGAARAPRARAAAARDLLSYLADFLNPGPVMIDLFNDPNKLNEAADIIQKLYTISQELPPDKFETARKKIEAKYDEIERNLIEDFVKAQNQGNISKMKEIASTMTNFKGYNQCVDAFIETSQMNALLGKDIFASVLPLCKKNYTIINAVFPNPEQVMSKFVLNIFHLKLQKYIQTKLADKNDVEKYLKNLFDMYTSTQRVCDELIAVGLVTAEDASTSGELRRNALVNGAMAGATDGYAALETRRLKAALANSLHNYYAEKQHVKKQIQTGGFQELRRDIQAVIGTRANINIAQIENYGGETFLSESLSKKMLNDSTTSFARCKTLCTSNELPNTVISLLDVLIQHLLIEHVDYAVEIGLQSIPIAENKSPPQIYFFDTVKEANKIIKMFEEHFPECVLSCLSLGVKQSECIHKKAVVMEQLETKMDAGLERSIQAVVGWVKQHLQNEQKKTDFKPEGDIDTIASPACATAVSFVRGVRERMGAALGPGAGAAAGELAVRLHRVIYDHLHNYQFNSAGAMIAICDVKEYRAAACGRHAPAPAPALFDALHALCNLLLVKPENLHQVCEGETLAELDPSILNNFIQLRSDFKSNKLSNFFKGLSS